jgi:hypothetical protein
LGRNFGELTHLVSHVHYPFIQQIKSNEYQCTAKKKKLRRERRREVNIRKSILANPYYALDMSYRCDFKEIDSRHYHGNESEGYLQKKAVGWFYS